MAHTREWLAGAIAALESVAPENMYTTLPILRAELAALPVEIEPDLLDLDLAEKALARAMQCGVLKHHEDTAEYCYDWCPLCNIEAALTAIRARRKP